MDHITNEALAVAIAGLRKEMELRAEANEVAITIATKNMDARLEGMNEFREQLNRQTHTFITRSEAELKHDQLACKVEDLSKRVSGSEMLKAEVTGKIWTLGVAITIYTTFMIALTGAILKYALR